MTAGAGDQKTGDCDLVIVVAGDCDCESLTPRRPSRQDLGNQMSPLHNLTLLQPRINLLVSSGQRRKTHYF